MKKTFLLIILFFTTIINAQEVKEAIQDWTAYSQAIPIDSKIGYEFRLSVAIRMENNQKSSKASLWTRIDKKDGKTAFFKNSLNDITVTNQWNIFEIKGTIDNDSSILNIGAYVQNSGDFFFDDFKLEVKKGKGKWESITINNPSFEEVESKDSKWNEGGGRNKVVKVKNFSIEYSTSNPYKGSKSLLIKGNNILGSSKTGKYVEVNGVNIYYEIYGEGEPLLMIHGNGNSMSGFVNQLDDFTKKYQVIFMDCRGRGNSTYQKDIELTFDIQIEDIKQFLDKLNIDKAHIVGWSDGGILGLLMAVKHPERVNKLVSMAANIFPEGCVDLDDMIKTRDELVADNKDHKNDLYIDLYNLDIKYPNLKYEDLSVIKSKTLIMAGDRDEIKNEHTIKMFEAIPGAQLAILPNSTHYLPQQNPKLFNQIVLDFLK